MTLHRLGECCNYVNIQSENGPAYGSEPGLGDYAKIRNYVYQNIMDDGQFLSKDSDGTWIVCSNYHYRLLQ